MKNTVKRRVLFIIIWLIFIFGLLQMAGYILFTFTSVKSIGSYGYPVGLYVYHPTLNFLYKPGFEGYFVGAGYGDIVLRINSDGFRDDPFPPGSAERRRIIVLGDSVVFGSGVWEEERFTELLQDHEAVQSAGIEVLNLGVNAYSFGHYLELARLDFMGLEPDLVIVGFTLNDIAKMDGAGPEKRVKPVKGKKGNSGQRKWYSKPDWVTRIQQSLDRTYAGKFVEHLKYTVKYARISEEEMKDYHTKWMRSVVDYWSEDQNRERLRGEILDFKAEMTRQGVPFAFLLFPERNDLLHPDEYSPPRESVRKLFDELDLGYCDAYDAFTAQTDVDSLYLINDSVHFTPVGHSIIRDVLLQCSEADIVSFPSGDEAGN
jgi:lysophospholipase L1-like esterase